MSERREEERPARWEKGAFGGSPAEEEVCSPFGGLDLSLRGHPLRHRNPQGTPAWYRRSLVIGPEGGLGAWTGVSQWVWWSVSLRASLHLAATSDQVSRAAMYNHRIGAPTQGGRGARPPEQEVAKIQPALSLLSYTP